MTTGFLYKSLIYIFPPEGQPQYSVCFAGHFWCKYLTDLQNLWTYI